MLLFKERHVKPILEDIKIETRRLWPKGRRAVPGAQHWATTKLYDKGAYFARLHIKTVYQEPLGDIDEEGARREGYKSREEFLEDFAVINRLTEMDTQEYLNLNVWVVQFRQLIDAMW